MRGTYNIFAFPSYFPFSAHTYTQHIFGIPQSPHPFLTFNFWHAVNCTEYTRISLQFCPNTFVNTFWIVLASEFLYTIFPTLLTFFGIAVEMI